jgi:hypothetical protein
MCPFVKVIVLNQNSRLETKTQHIDYTSSNP